MNGSTPKLEVLTSSEAGALLGVSAATVKRWSDEGALRSIRTRGGHRRFRRADVEQCARALERGGSGLGALAQRLADAEPVLRVQAELLALRARSASWQDVVDECASALRAVAELHRTTGTPQLATRISQAILAQAVGRCADELPTAPDAPKLVVAAVEDEPFPTALSLARLTARAAGWKAWSIGAVATAELTSFAAAPLADALLVFASVASSRAAQALDAAEAACDAAGVALAVAGGAPWPQPRTRARVLRSLGEVPEWLARCPRATDRAPLEDATRTLAPLRPVPFLHVEAAGGRTPAAALDGPARAAPGAGAPPGSRDLLP